MKQIYESPRIEVIGVENEGVMAASGSISDIGHGGDIYQSTSTSGGAKNNSQSTLSELEDLINDILTY